jgi:hypothetical protein
VVQRHTCSGKKSLAGSTKKSMNCLFAGGINKINECMFNRGEDLFSSIYRILYITIWHSAILGFLLYRVSRKSIKKRELISRKHAWFTGFISGILFLASAFVLYGIIGRSMAWLYLPISEFDSWLYHHLPHSGGGWITLFPDPNEFLIFLLIPAYFGVLTLLARFFYRFRFAKIKNDLPSLSVQKKDDIQRDTPVQFSEPFFSETNSEEVRTDDEEIIEGRNKGNNSHKVR